jgi:hypothetical protein
MRKLSCAVAMAAASLVVPSSASADIVPVDLFNDAVSAMQAIDPTLQPPPNDGRHDFVVGGFTNFLGEQVAVSAHRDLATGAVKGSETVKGREGGSPFTTKLRVTCLDTRPLAGQVFDGLAAFTTKVTSTNGGDFALGQEFLELARDAGPGGVGDGHTPSDTATSCAGQASQGIAAAQIISGNVLVNDQ